MQPSVPKVSLKYERVGYIFTKEHTKPTRRWSLDYNDNHSSRPSVEDISKNRRARHRDFRKTDRSSSSDEDISKDSTAREYWKRFASIQEFALY